jgi:hypothetical protein
MNQVTVGPRPTCVTLNLETRSRGGNSDMAIASYVVQHGLRSKPIVGALIVAIPFVAAGVVFASGWTFTNPAAALETDGITTSAATQTNLINPDRSASPGPAAAAWWSRDVTALTMAPDGAWGISTASSTNLALANAIENCKRMSRAELGCGASVQFSRGDWIIAVRCGSDNILATDPTLVDARRHAAEIEADVRYRYMPDLPACVQVLTVDPSGLVISSE